MIAGKCRCTGAWKRSQRLASASLMLACVLYVSAARAARDELDAGFGEETSEDTVGALLGENTALDLDQIETSHLSMIATWDGVQRRLPAQGTTNAPAHWREEDNGLVAPLDTASITTLVDVPRDGTYRMSLHHEIDSRAPRPITLTLTPQKGATEGTNAVSYAAAGSPIPHVFGAICLAPGLPGRDQEKKLPVRFETEAQRLTTPSDNMLLWEHWDIPLHKGVYRAAWAATDLHPRLHALFISLSKDFRPSFAPREQDRTLGRVYMRFRAGDAHHPSGATFAVNATLTYHWARRAPRSTEDCWGWPIGATPATPAGQWSPFVDATEAIVPGAGPWSTCNLSLKGITEGSLEVQFAWRPLPAAVIHTVKTVVGGGSAMLRVPHGDWNAGAQPGVPAGGIWSGATTTRILTQEAVIERYFRWADAAAARLNLEPGHPGPKRIRLFSGCGVLPPNRERAVEMLAKLGLNWIDGAPDSLIAKSGLRDEKSAYNVGNAAGLAANFKTEAERAKLTKVNTGDEIGTYTDPAIVNHAPGDRAAFHTYMTEQARLEGMDLESFLGTDDPREIECIGTSPAGAGRYERRLFYHSQKFCHLITCDRYASLTRELEKHFPNVRVYNNYSPHPVFVTGTTMNEGDWFVLPRHKAQTLGWAEDWATGGSWGLGTAFQCTSFYAALVECGARKQGYPSGFYIVMDCGGGAVKIFGCVAQGVTWLHLYDWGPIDHWAEGSNAWSEDEWQYYPVMCAAHALGPADEIIGAGQRERRRTAILYNRSHEIVNGGLGRLNHDWMWSFIGLRSSQIPVDVIIEDDLNPDDLKRYDCIMLGGFNLAKHRLAELKKWVEAGGLLIGSGGAASRDIYNDPMPEADALFGARQRLTGKGETGAVSRVAFSASEFFPAASFTPGGMTFVLEPSTGTSVATYAGGQCAATINTVGKGHAILLGFQPGLTFRDNGRALGPLRQWLAAPALKRLGRQRVEFDDPASEATLFEHESGLAVTLAHFGGAATNAGNHLSVQTDRPVNDVVSALHGPLEWKRIGDRIEIKPTPLDLVDVVILK